MECAKTVKLTPELKTTILDVLVIFAHHGRLFKQMELVQVTLDLLIQTITINQEAQDKVIDRDTDILLIVMADKD